MDNVVLMVNTIWTKENGLSYLMRFWLVMKPSSLYFKVVIVVSYLKMLLVCSCKTREIPISGKMEKS